VSLVIRTVGPSVGWWKGRERQRESDVGMRVERERTASRSRELFSYRDIFVKSSSYSRVLFVRSKTGCVLGSSNCGLDGGCVP